MQEHQTLAAVGFRQRPDLAVITVTGEDQRAWLNGQITNDVRATRAGDAVYALVLNVRGKILSDLWALDRGDGFALVVPRSKQQSLVEHLEHYIIMEDVTLTAADETAVVSLHGPASAAVSQGLAHVYPCDDLHDGGRYVLCPKDALASCLEQLGARAAQRGGGPLSEQAAEQARVLRGIPRFGTDFDEAHYPQEAGLKASAVSFSKGCYLGQEVVCTLENRGKLSRRLVQWSSHGGAHGEISVGDLISTEAHDESGRITSVVHDATESRGLGYARRIHIEQALALRVREQPLDIKAPTGE